MASKITTAGLFVLAFPVAAVAQAAGEHRLDSVLVSGLRPVDASQLTEDVTVLDAEDLAIRDTPYVADQLRAVPGVAVSRSGNIGGLTQVRLRGAEANHTLVLLDGIEFSDPVTGETDFGLLSAIGLDRIEVLRGEQSALYGSDAIGGVIGIYTSDDPGLRGQVEAGSRDTLRGSLGGGVDLGGGTLQAAVSGFGTEGFDVSGRSGETDGSRNGAFLLKSKTRLNEAWSLAALATYRDSYVETDPDLDFDGRLDNADRTTDSEQFIVGAALEGQTGVINHVFRANFNDVNRENRADGAYTDEAAGQRTKLSWSPSFSTSGALSQTVSLLIDYEREDYERISTDTAFGDPNQTKAFETTGLAGEYSLSAGGWNANASLRQDYNGGEFDNATTWRVGTSYTLSSRTRLRASAGRGVKNPTFTELFGFYPGSFLGNPDLVPETSESWEVGVDQMWDSGEASITYFSADLEDEIYTAYTPAFLSTAENRTGKSQRSGVEAALVLELMEGLNLRGQATSFSSENETGADEIRVPDWTGSLALSWTPGRKGARYGIAVDYVGDQYDFNFGTFPSERVTLDAYTLVSASAEWPINDRISLTVRGENLFDQDAVDVFGYASAGAAGFIGLKLR